MRKHRAHLNSNPKLGRNCSQPSFTYDQTKTIAELNHVSSRHHNPVYSASKPFRIVLPDYFNIPKFTDQPIIGHLPSSSNREIIAQIRTSIEVKRKLKDLEVLAMGMHRAKSIKE